MTARRTDKERWLLEQLLAVLPEFEPVAYESLDEEDRGIDAVLASPRGEPCATGVRSQI